VLEAMASGRCVLSCNPAAVGVLKELEAPDARFAFEAGNAEELADRIEALLALDAGRRVELGSRARAIVARDHEVDALMRRLVREMGARA
jgi:glycosyltransferase involved in cell wall biosynthesis